MPSLRSCGGENVSLPELPPGSLLQQCLPKGQLVQTQAILSGGIDGKVFDRIGFGRISVLLHDESCASGEQLALAPSTYKWAFKMHLSHSRLTWVSRRGLRVAADRSSRLRSHQP